MSRVHRVFLAPPLSRSRTPPRPSHARCPVLVISIVLALPVPVRIIRHSHSASAPSPPLLACNGFTGTKLSDAYSPSPASSSPSAPQLQPLRLHVIPRGAAGA
ncbi:hypothetical protein B0H14DRAFT_3445580 [Mycena olivaceomarginata]|nr:hypothetical protein B0H14DRAFT_3445580 [Mycena olivaceomarginata]